MFTPLQKDMIERGLDPAEELMDGSEGYFQQGYRGRGAGAGGGGGGGSAGMGMGDYNDTRNKPYQQG